ncbi:MAG: glycoside hydrolase family 130 protein, partial [Thermoanaerobacterium sp.]|nr:glycoside hydrolase family 130 protein [Thermoanaerobacterium sp.]
VAEVPHNDEPDTKLVPIFDPDKGMVVIKKFDKQDKDIDFSDSRFVRTKTEQYLTSISHFRIARSKNGIHFDIDEKPAMFPSNVYEKFGIEDPRITYIDGRYYINYSAISDITGVTTCLASTVDFKTFKRHGCIFTPDNKDVAIFPEKIGGKYYALCRPASAEYKRRDMWISESPDLICWGNHRYLMGAREGYWDDGRVGCSAVPFKIDEGWLEIYHGASKNDRYCLGAVLLDANKPWKILARSQKPIIEPETDYELNGFYGNVIFNCGVLFEEGKVKIYYGAADTCIAYAEIQLCDVLNSLS